MDFLAFLRSIHYIVLGPKLAPPFVVVGSQSSDMIKLLPKMHDCVPLL